MSLARLLACWRCGLELGQQPEQQSTDLEVAAAGGRHSALLCWYRGESDSSPGLASPVLPSHLDRTSLPPHTAPHTPENGSLISATLIGPSALDTSPRSASSSSSSWPHRDRPPFPTLFPPPPVPASRPPSADTLTLCHSDRCNPLRQHHPHPAVVLLSRR